MVEKINDKESWFVSWFDSDYYHSLYSNRDETEARDFIVKLCEVLSPSSQSKVLDLACGKGRHTRTLASLDLDVCGLDLSENSIAFAKQFEKDNLRFDRHDMREVFMESHFDYIFNFFTSFGYFDTEEDHYLAISSIAKNLKAGGVFVMDYLNSEFVATNLVRENKKTIDGIEFSLKRKCENGYFVKDIYIRDGAENFHFQEKVRSFDLSDFELMLGDAGLELTKTYGDYDLSVFSPKSSTRLILQAQKI